MKTLALFNALLPIVSASASTFNLYGYGVGIGGLSLIYADGLAYLGACPSNASVATNVTVTLKSGVLTVNPNTTDAWTGNKYLYVDTDAGAYDPVKLASNASGYTDTDFMFYGRVLFHSGSSGMESYFYATPLDANNATYALKWNSNSTDDGVSVPIALRTIGP